MVSEPDYSKDIWKPLKVPDDGRNCQQEAPGSMNDPPDIKEQQAKKIFPRTDHSSNSFTATSTAILTSYYFLLSQQPAIWTALPLKNSRLLNKACKAWRYTMSCL